MGNRYIVTGVQMGMLKVFIQKDLGADAEELLDSIIEKQEVIEDE